MAYIVIKTIKGRQYRYLQRSWREGKRVRTQAVSLGPVNGTPRRLKALTFARDFDRKSQEEEYNREMGRIFREDAEYEAWQRRTFGETGAERQAREAQERHDRIYTDIGLPVPAPQPTEK